MKSPILELQQAIKTELIFLGYKVFDGLPMGEEDYPFIVFDNDSITDDETIKAGSITDILFPFYIWSDYANGGSKEAKEIADSIIQALVDKEDTISMTSFTCEKCSFFSMRINRQKDNLKQLTQLILTLGFKISED